MQFLAVKVLIRAPSVRVIFLVQFDPVQISSNCPSCQRPFPGSIPAILPPPPVHTPLHPVRRLFAKGPAHSQTLAAPAIGQHTSVVIPLLDSTRVPHSVATHATQPSTALPISRSQSSLHGVLLRLPFACRRPPSSRRSLVSHPAPSPAIPARFRWPARDHVQHARCLSLQGEAP